MGGQNNQVSPIRTVFSSLFADIADLVPVPLRKGLEHDLKYVLRRLDSEGVAFATEQLSDLGKEFDLALMRKKNFAPSGRWKPYLPGTQIPRFLSCFWEVIFEKDGSLRDESTVDPLHVRAVRQILRTFSKYEDQRDSSAKNAKVLQAFVDADEGCEIVASSDNRYLYRAQRILDEVFSGFDPLDIRPRHGPGAVATGEKDEQKWTFSRIYESVHKVYPAWSYYYCTTATSEGNKRIHLAASAAAYRQMQRLPEPTAKVVLVPKDYRGPRVISMEPLELQFLQQGLGRKMMARVESHPITKGRVNFLSQEFNRQAALLSSKDASLATLDMKEASDRVSKALVEALFPSGLREALLALRSTSTILPDGRVVRMKKYAPMGSALCFPVEALVFYALSVACLQEIGASRPFDVLVFGDDIIVPREYAEPIMTVLEDHGLLVNRDKSCTEGFFYESCGMDAFRGESVTPVRVKKTLGVPHKDRGSICSSLVGIATEMSQRRYLRTSELFRLWACDAGNCFVPYSPYKSDSFLSVYREDFPEGVFYDTIREARRRYSQKKNGKNLVVAYSPKRDATLCEYSRLVRDLLTVSDEPDRWSSKTTKLKPFKGFGLYVM